MYVLACMHRYKKQTYIDTYLHTYIQANKQTNKHNIHATQQVLSKRIVTISLAFNCT